MPLPNIYPVTGASGGAIRKPWRERDRDSSSSSNNNNNNNNVFCLNSVSHYL